MENQEGIPLAKIPIVQVPASEAKPSPEPVTTCANIYPMVEEVTFRGIIKSEEEGYALLQSVQTLVNEFGTDTIIKVVGALAKKPGLLAKAKSYLPYLSML